MSEHRSEARSATPKDRASMLIDAAAAGGGSMSSTDELPADAYQELEAAERQPHQPRARRSFHWPTVALVLALVATLGFLAGVQVQKRHTPATIAVASFAPG